MAVKKSKSVNVITAKSEEFLRQYLNNASPTGFESAGQKLWLDYIKPYIDKHQIDHYGTATAVINPNEKYKVVIEAHADEISWFVNYISDNGMIYVRRNGGSDHQIAPSKRVNIHTKKGIVKGIFGWTAIHLREPGKEEAPNLRNIFIDVGAKKRDEVHKLGIHVGCVITYEDEFMILNRSNYVGRALDNRIGGFMIAEVARLLKENNRKLPFGLYIVNAVQEEVGLRGAHMIAESIRPNVAIVTDVSHDTTTPGINKLIEGDYKLGSGPIVTYAPQVHYKLLDIILETAEKNKISIQREAASRVTGTDTDAFSMAAGGIPSALISLPLRYMHTTVEMVDKQDVSDVIRLIYQTLIALTPGYNYRYI